MDILVILGIILVIGWALGFFAFGVVSSFIHILLVIGLILLVVRLLRGGRARI